MWARVIDVSAPPPPSTRASELLLEGNCGDVAVTDSTVVVCASGSPMPAYALALDGTLIATYHTTSRGYFPRTDGRVVVSHDGERFRHWTLGGEDIPLPDPLWPANNPIGISPGGTIALQVQDGVYVDGRKVADYKPTGIWIVDDDGSVEMMDDCNRPSWAPGSGGYAHQCGDLIVAEASDGGVLVTLAGETRLLDAGLDTKWPRGSQRNGVVAIKSWHDNTERIWCGTRAEVLALPKPAPVLPALPAGRTLDVGYFFRMTAIFQYGKPDPDGGVRFTKNPAAPCTTDIIVDEYGLPSDPTPDGFSPSMIVSPPCLWQMVNHPEWWPRTTGVYICAEGSLDLLNATASTTRYLMQQLGLPDWPLITYTGNALFPDALRPTDTIGVQLYCPKDRVMTPAEALAMGRTELVKVRHRKVALVCQAYDRARPDVWTGEALAAVQSAWWQLALENPNVWLIALFSDGRTGGVRWHEEMRPYHHAMVREARRR
jgi:hypothetical protein